LASAVKKLLSLPVSWASDIERVAGGENPFTAGSADNTAVKVDVVFTAESYAGPAVKPVITSGYSNRRGPAGNGLVVIRITAGYLKIVGKGPSSE
jgi:hypothetical protein